MSHERRNYSKRQEIFQLVGITPDIECSTKSQRLQGYTDSEEKRKTIGAVYIEMFEKEMTRLQPTRKKCKFYSKEQSIQMSSK